MKRADAERAFILSRALEDIADLTVVAFRPHLESIVDADQLCGDAEPRPRLANASGQDMADAQFCRDLADLNGVKGEEVDLRRVWSGRTEYGTDWLQPLAGGHTLCAGATAAGKNSVGWAPIVSIAPAIRDGLVRVSGIDPKGMELAYGRRIFHRYAVTSRDALALLDDLVDGMERRKTEFAGRVRTVPVSRRQIARFGSPRRG